MLGNNLLKAASRPVSENPPTVPSAPSTTNDPYKSVKRWQLQCGRDRKRVEEFSHQLDLARADYTRVSQENVADEHLNADEVAGSITAAWGKVQALETGLKIAEQKLDNSEHELKLAGADVQKAIVLEHKARHDAEAEKIVAWLDAGVPLYQAYAKSRKAVQDLGDEEMNRKIQAADLAHKTYLFRVCPQMPGCNTGYEAFQSDPKWSLPWSSHLR